MTLKKENRTEIKQFILLNLRQHPKDIVRVTQEKYSLSRTTINKYMREMAGDKQLSIQGSKTRPEYSLVPIHTLSKTYSLDSQLAEDRVWRQDLFELFSGLPKNVLDICHYGFTEIFNNAIDHSEGTKVTVNIDLWVDLIKLKIRDDGVGIFNKIQQKFNLDDPLHAILELSKGKLTTDPASHTGEGIFFTSRMFDQFTIISGRLTFAHIGEDLLVEVEKNLDGTLVFMAISPLSKKTTESVFNQFTDEDMNFDKTIVPVFLARYGDENLISRSQAKRLLARFEKFKRVVLDFDRIDTIGRAFADEIFRVYKNAHPEIDLGFINASESITKLIQEIQANPS
jgi:anti-sigma regulatory factor (Ser/Thr protein kinase)